MVRSAYSEAAGTSVLRGIRAAIPRSWMPIARRGLSGVVAHLPTSVKARLIRLVGLISPDMHLIERDYPAWIERFDRLELQTRHRIAEQINRMDHRPLISVLMPVFNTPPDHLRAAISSVKHQFYPWWELCIADDASTNPDIHDILTDAVASDPRIKLIRRQRNGHISAASNSALELASGLFVALLDHDDILPPHALFEVAAKIVSQPDVDIIYSDEDHIDSEGRRSHPYFKPDWNPDLMLGQNLISHLGVYRRDLMLKIGGFRIGFEGSQDHDLALRVVAETSADRIAHIPKVLYHWRQATGDRTFSEAAQARCALNGRRAIQSFVSQRQPAAGVEAAPNLTSGTRVVYPIPTPQPLVSVIITNANSTSALLHCIDWLLNRTHYANLELLIPDDEPQRNDFAADSRVRIVLGQGRPSAEAVATAGGELLLLLDASLEARDPAWLSELVHHALRSDIGAVGAKVLRSDQTIAHAGIVVGGPLVAFSPFSGRRRTHAGYFGYLQLTRSVTAVSGGCLMVRKQAFLAAGSIDDSLIPMFGDLDLCLKLETAGLRTVWTPYAELYWRDDQPQPDHAVDPGFQHSAVCLRQRWGKRLLIDPYWNPNLALDPQVMALAFPPHNTTDSTLQAA